MPKLYHYGYTHYKYGNITFMISRALDRNNDIYFTNGRSAFVNDADEVAQHQATRLRFYLGEWFLDTNAGTPWFQSIFVKPFNQQLTESIIKDRILQTPGTEELTEFSAEYFPSKSGENPARSFSVKYSCRSIYGEISEQEINV